VGEAATLTPGEIEPVTSRPGDLAAESLAEPKLAVGGQGRAEEITSGGPDSIEQRDR
jgi:hypothetical protein